MGFNKILSDLISAKEQIEIYLNQRIHDYIDSKELESILKSCEEVGEYLDLPSMIERLVQEGAPFDLIECLYIRCKSIKGYIEIDLDELLELILKQEVSTVKDDPFCCRDRIEDIFKWYAGMRNTREGWSSYFDKKGDKSNG